MDVDDPYRWCRSLTVKVFLETLLRGCLINGVTNEQLEAVTLEVIALLNDVALDFPANIDRPDVVDAVRGKALDRFKSLWQSSTDHSATTAGAMTTMIAGYEQRSSIMFWSLVHHSQRPLHSIPNANRKYFLNEVIRLHSPTWTIMRRPLRSLVVDDCRLPKGSVVIASPWIIAREADYFPTPSSFLPERWASSVNAQAYFPYCHGPRVCKGKRFVRSVLYEMLAVLQRYAVWVGTISPDDEEAAYMVISHTPESIVGARIQKADH